MRLIDFGELILLGAIWGLSFMLIKSAVPEFGVFALVVVRAIGATLILLPFVLVKKQQRDLFIYWKQLLVLGLLNTAIPFCLFNYGLLQMEAGLAAILNGTAPMFGIIVAYLYLKERIGVTGLVGVILGFAGIVLISYEQTTSVNTSIVPVLSVLLACLCYGIAAAYLRAKLAQVKPFASACGSQFFTALILLPFILFDMPQAVPQSDAIFSALILAFLCTGLAYVLYFDLISKVGASKAMTVGYLVPLFGVIWGYLVLNETLSSQELLGGLIILIGVMLATNIHTKFKRKQIVDKP